jgi:hypothetical protein
MLTQTVGQVANPLSRVQLACSGPSHCALAMAHILPPSANVTVAAFVHTGALAMLHVILPIT